MPPILKDIKMRKSEDESSIFIQFDFDNGRHWEMAFSAKSTRDELIGRFNQTFTLMARDKELD
jgi:hypothetical protein